MSRDRSNSSISDPQQADSEPVKARQAFRLGPGAWRGAAYGLVAVTALIWFGALVSSSPASTQSWLLGLGFAVVAGGLSLALGNLIVTLLSQFQKKPELYRWLLVGTVFLLFNMLQPTILTLPSVIGMIVLIVIVTSLFGAGIGALRDKRLARANRRVALGALALGGVGLLAGTIWFAWEGPEYQVPQYARDVEASEIAAWPALDNPARPGPHEVLMITYGSGTDRHRPEYGTDVTIQTPTVDVSSMVSGWSGIVGWLRSSFWGFDLTNAPLNARVWYPDGDGSFPLVLIVHGNHAMDDFSDPGYDYLGELLASRGFIVASVDQNFLNGSGLIEGILGELRGDNNARGYLLLEHLALWHEWNATDGHQFAGMVDTRNIALIGHSRGGEAAAIATAFNHLPVHPDNADLRFDFGYSIRAVVAIAPSDGQYQPRRRSTPLENVNYLVLQGAADSDARSFHGSNQYDRVSFASELPTNAAIMANPINADGDSYFKAAVYVHGANHGQFNTVWGRVDQPGSRWFLNRGEIIPADEQRAVARVFIGGFLETTLRDQGQYEALFAEQRLGDAWLPGSVYLTQYLNSRTQLVATFEEDLDLQSTSMPGGRLEGANLTHWREEPLTLGSGRRRDSVSVQLGWDHERNGEGIYRLQLLKGFSPGENSAITFALANTTTENDPLDFTIRVTDRGARQASLPLSHVRFLPAPLKYRMTKPPLGVTFESEPVFTTYTFALDDFAAENPELDAGDLSEVSFIFDRSPRGRIAIDDIGFRSLD